jgi:tetrahydromethanopterin S-methyltransferase subunit A
MDKLGEIIGDICKIVLPIREDFYLGNPASDTAVCTLGSISLLKDLRYRGMLQNVAIIGRLFSENKGIDALVRFVNQNHNIRKIVICGKEVWGHKAGHSLIQLHEHGVDENRRIVGSLSPDPYLSVTNSEIEYFQNNIRLVNLTGETRLDRISARI